jgi:23S rRNA-/tRNA-specific pseudouridylate synthase
VCLSVCFPSAQHGTTLGRLCPVHRLDRNVSGLLVFARGAAAANALRIQIQARRALTPLANAQTRKAHARAYLWRLFRMLLRCAQAGDVVKEYVACVVGSFPDGPDGVPAFVVDAPLLYDYKARRAQHARRRGRVAHDNIPELSSGCMCVCVCAQLRRTAVGTGPSSKVAATAFRRLATSADGTRSLVACRPLTGRTHQVGMRVQARMRCVVSEFLSLVCLRAAACSCADSSASAPRWLPHRQRRCVRRHGGGAGGRWRQRS